MVEVVGIFVAASDGEDAFRSFETAALLDALASPKPAVMMTAVTEAAPVGPVAVA